MSKDAYWFRHDANARNDLRIIDVRRRLGWEGYGIYFAILEVLRDSSGYEISESELTAMLYDMRIEEQKFEVLITCGLLKRAKGKIYSSSFIGRMSQWDDVRRKRAAAGKAGGSRSRASSNCLPIAKQLPTNCQPIVKLEQDRENRTERTNSIAGTTASRPAERWSLADRPADAGGLAVATMLDERFGERLQTLSAISVEKLISALSDPLLTGTDVEGELAKAARWEAANRTKTAKGLPKFLLGWVERAHNRGSAAQLQQQMPVKTRRYVGE